MGIVFFGATGIFGIKKLFSTQIGLTIDSTGITDHSNASSIGLIEWKDITDITPKQIMSTKFLLIHVANPQEYIAKAKNAITAKLMKSNMKMYGTPLSITSASLKYDFEKLETLIQNTFAEKKKSEKS